jgi:hypothetical protein
VLRAPKAEDVAGGVGRGRASHDGTRVHRIVAKLGIGARGEVRSALAASTVRRAR